MLVIEIARHKATVNFVKKSMKTDIKVRFYIP